MNRKLRVGFAGAGAISRFHMAGWRETDEAEVLAICDPDGGRARALAEAFGVPRTYSGLAEMLDAESLDAVDIATPVGTHAELARLAADRGVHVCCQKPLTPTVREAEALIACVGDRVRFMVHENYRFRPHYEQVGEWLRAGRIGRVLHARMTVRA